MWQFRTGCEANFDERCHFFKLQASKAAAGHIPDPVQFGPDPMILRLMKDMSETFQELFGVALV